MPKNIAINGFGRIGKAFLRTIMIDPSAQKNLKIVAINLGPDSPAHLDHFFKYDTTLGTFDGTVSFENSVLTINNHKVNNLQIQILTESDPTKLPWAKLDIDWVVEASGAFTTKEKALTHLIDI